MAVGLAILATSRPYEGMLFSVPVALFLLWTLWKRKHKARLAVTLLLIPCATVIGLAYYNMRFTGNPLQLPYAFYRQNFTMAPHFVFQSPRPQPVFHHHVLQHYHMGWEMNCYTAASENRPPYGLVDKVKVYWRFFVGPTLTIPLLCLLFLWRKRRIRILLLALLWFAAGLAVEVWQSPHYAAPVLGLVVLLVIVGLRVLQQKTPIWISGVVLCGCLFLPVINGSGVAPGGSGRPGILRQLEASGGRHLILVRYAFDHHPGDEWVYNAANIDAAPVVWARELDVRSNRKLLEYFRGRQVWLVQPDQPAPKLARYDEAAPAPSPAFVKLGDGAIEALRSPEEIRRAVIERAGSESLGLNCDQWNSIFTTVTGFEAPDASKGCFTAGHRVQPIAFETWFHWINDQR